MLHATCTKGNWVDSRLLMVESQIANLTPGPYFGHNLCFRCSNGRCKPILDIYVSTTFQWYEKLFKKLGFDLCNCSLNIRESIGIPTPNMGIHLGVREFSPSRSFALMGHENATPGLSLGLHVYKPFCLRREPKVRVVTLGI